METKKILVVDFDQEFLKFLSQYLHNEGFSVITAADGFAGLEKFKTERPDLVITEAMLPKLHGFELCSRITNNQGWKTPVIIVTGVYKDTIYKTEALRTFGAAAYLEKPLDTDELMGAIRKTLGLAPGHAKKEDVIDQAIVGAILPVSKEKPSSNGHPPAETPEPEKSVKTKAPGTDDIDNMLQSTLAGLGLAGEKKKVPETKPKPPVVKPVPPAKPVVTPPKPAVAPKPVSQSVRVEKAEPKPEPKPEKIKREAPAIETRKAPAETSFETLSKAPTAAFGGYTEPKKKSGPSKILIGAVAGGLAVVVTVVFVLKPGKPKPTAPARVAAVSTEAVETRSLEVPPQNTEVTTEIQAKVPDTPVRPASQKPAAQKPAATTPPSLTDIRPLESEARPKLEIQVPTAPAPKENTNPVSDQAPVAQNPVQTADSAQLQSPAPKTESPGIPVPKVKTGDLIPLSEADVLPQPIKTESPVYPPVAMRLQVEGTVTVNALISETGNVVQTSIIRGIKGTYGFDAEAQNAVRKWKFTPAKKDGVNVRVWKTINVIFKLKK